MALYSDFIRQEWHMHSGTWLISKWIYDGPNEYETIYRVEDEWGIDVDHEFEKLRNAIEFAEGWRR